MIKKPDLRIDTEFFDDNLNGLIIPEAIRVTQSIDTQTFIKQGLNDEGIDNVTVLAIEAIEKIVSQRLFDNFLDCWRRLKQSVNARFSLESTPYSQKGHKRPSLIRNRASRQEITIQISENRSNERQELQLNQLRSDSQGDALGWLDEQRKIVKNKSVVRGLSRKKSSAAETHLQRAKVLKEIVDKLRQGRHLATGLIDRIDNQQENQQLHHKLNKLQRLMQDVHYSATQRVTAPQRYSLHYSQTRDKKSDEIEGELSARLKQDLTQVKSQMLKIRKSNQQLLRDEQWRRAQIERIASIRQQTKQQYEALRYQIQHLKQDKKIDQVNNLRLQQQLSFSYAHRQDYERQISFLAQRVNQSEQRAQMQAIHRSTERQIIPVQTNPFGYSTFATSQKNSQAVVNSWEQSARPVGAKARPHRPNQQAREAADEWSCC